MLKRSAVLYGSETWSLRKTEEIALEIFKRNILRKIFGPCKDNRTGDWRKRYNQKHQNLFQCPNITKWISVRKLNRTDRHAWSNQRSIVKGQQSKTIPTGKRPLGRPRLKRENSVIRRDAGTVKSSVQLREAAENRNRWRNTYIRLNWASYKYIL